MYKQCINCSLVSLETEGTIWQCPRCHCHTGGSINIHEDASHSTQEGTSVPEGGLQVSCSGSALDVQEGGSHYKHYAIQPLEFCERNKLGCCQSNVVKYVVRYKDKGGLEDLRKAKHYLDVLIEMEYGKDTGV